MDVSRHTFEYILILLASIVLAFTAEEPCTDFINIGDVRRSIEFEYNPDAEESICDFDISEGHWYIFNTTRLAAIPERDVVDFYYCGTFSPVFVKARAGDDTYHEEAQINSPRAVSAPVCSYYVDLEGECDWSEEIQIQYCQKGNYFVYFLQKPPGCPMAYCTDDDPRCPPGDYWDEQEQVCKKGYPAMYEPTLAGPYVTDSGVIKVCGHLDPFEVDQFAFDCRVGYDKPVQDDDARFEIYLTANDVVVGQPVYVTSMDAIHTFKEKDIKPYMGQNVGCQVSSYYEGFEDSKSPARKSNTYWIGIYAESITVDRNNERSGQIHTVPIYSTVPITCYHCTTASTDTCTCCEYGCKYTYEIGIDDNGLINSDQCLVEITNRTLTSIDGPFHVADIDVAVHDDPDMKAINNFLIKFDYMPLVPCYQPKVGGRIWDNFEIKPIGVYIKENDYSPFTCHSILDPHIKDVYGREGVNLMLGDMRLARVSKQQEEIYMEIQERHFQCRSDGTADKIASRACNCAVIVREGNSMLGIDACDDSVGYDKTNVRQIRYLRTEVDGTVVEDGSTLYMDAEGVTYYIVMKSGLEVKVAIADLMNIYVTFPKDYAKEEIEGMCNWESTDEAINFRVDGEESLFEKNPPWCFEWESLKEGALSCHCNKKSDSDNQLLCGTDTAAFIPGNYSVANVKHSEYVCSFNETRLRNIQPLIKNNIYPAFTMNEQDKSDDVIDTSEIYYNFEYDANLGLNFTISWPTKSGITEVEAKDACLNALRSSQAYTACEGMFNEEQLTQSCAIDVNVLDDVEFASDYIAAMESICLDTSIAAANVSSIDELRNDTTYNSIANNVCPSQCNKQGECVNGMCICNTGYVGGDCSVNSNEPPTLSAIYNNGSCDLTKKYCAKITVYVSNMYNSPLLQCRYTAVPLIPEMKNEPEYLLTNASYVNAHQLNCPTPPTKVGTSYAYQLAITNDGVLFSEELPYVIYDPTCVEQHDDVWTQKTGTCLHNDVCYTRDQRQSDENCLVCTSDDQSVNQWTDTTQWQGWTNCSRSCDMGVIENHYGCPGVSYEVELRSCHLKNCTDRPEYENEGVQLTFYEGDSLLQSLYQSDELFNQIARAVNDYCSNNTDECCPQMSPGGNTDVDITTGWLIYFDTGDPYVYANIFFMRILVTTQPSSIEKLCGIENEDMTYMKEDTPLFVSSEAVVSAVTIAKSDIEQALGILIGSIN